MRSPDPDPCSDSNTPLTPADLLARGPLARLGQCVLVFDALDSTQAELARRASELPDGTLALAEHQTAGRGRMGHSWSAPPLSSVLLSVLLRESPASRLPGLSTTAAAVAACEAVESVLRLQSNIRWPNDLVIDGKKFGGVLAESAPEPRGGRVLIVGVGLNCSQRPEEFAGEWRGRATSLAMAVGRPFARASLAAELVSRLDYWSALGDSPELESRVRRSWRSRCRDVGSTAVLTCNGRTWNGRIIQIHEDGHLVVVLANGERMSFGAETTQRSWETPLA